MLTTQAKIVTTRAEPVAGTLDEARRYREFVASTGAVDSHNSVVRQNWRLSRYQSNPIVLRDHDNRRPVGSAVLRIEGERLIAGITFARGDEEAEKTWNLVRQDILRSSSVGFLPGGVEVRADGVLVYDSPELYELSVVSVPSNPEALARSARETPYTMSKESETARDQRFRALIRQHKEEGKHPDVARNLAFQTTYGDLYAK